MVCARPATRMPQSRAVQPVRPRRYCPSRAGMRCTWVICGGSEPSPGSLGISLLSCSRGLVGARGRGEPGVLSQPGSRGKVRGASHYCKTSGTVNRRWQSQAPGMFRSPRQIGIRYQKMAKPAGAMGQKNDETYFMVKKPHAPIIASASCGRTGIIDHVTGRALPPRRTRCTQKA